MSTKPVASYKVHTDQKGQVWFAPPDQMPVQSLGGISGFMRAPPMGKDDSVQIIAEANNVPVILHLYERKLEGKLASVQICSPNSENRKRRPEVMMLDSHQWTGWPASMGGWHEFTEDDYPSYYLAKHHHTKADLAILHNVLKLHPAWNALSFIPHLNEDKCARLIGLILDPRWFVDPEEPDKNARLEAYLGLLPPVQTALAGGTAKDDEEFKATDKQMRHCKLVMECWRMGRPTSKAEYAQPTNFLWRLHAMEGSGTMANLRASQTFIAFLKYVWLDAMYKNRGGVSYDGLFVPEYFFKQKDEVNAFKDHIKRFNKR